MRKIICYVIAMCLILYPIIRALTIGYEYIDLFGDVLQCSIGVFLIATTIHLIKRVEKLERQCSEDEKAQHSDSGQDQA